MLLSNAHAAKYTRVTQLSILISKISTQARYFLFELRLLDKSKGQTCPPRKEENLLLTSHRSLLKKISFFLLKATSTVTPSKTAYTKKKKGAPRKIA